MNPLPKLSINLNKIALLRNSRNQNFPDVLKFAHLAIRAGAEGITMHPRPDLRHIHPRDVFEFREAYPDFEFNLEGNPFSRAGANYPGFLSLVKRAKPQQCTLVPDDPQQLTSDHGWDLKKNRERLKPVVDGLNELGIRVSLFVDEGCPDLEIARELNASRIELYTERFSRAFGTSAEEKVFKQYLDTAEEADQLGLGINAGHDLNLDNLKKICRLPRLLEVSIGHALTVDALYMGFTLAVAKYREEIEKSSGLCTAAAEHSKF